MVSVALIGPFNTGLMPVTRRSGNQRSDDHGYAGSRAGAVRSIEARPFLSVEIGATARRSFAQHVASDRLQ